MTALPAKQQTGASPREDEALDILRRLEPLLTRQDDRLTAMENELARLPAMEKQLDRQDDRLTAMEKELARLRSLENVVHELKGKVSELPNLIQIIGSVMAVFGGMIALAVAAANFLLRP